MCGTIKAFFKELNCEVVHEVNESTKLIRYSFKRKTSMDF